MALSVLVALILTPALCATILKPRRRRARRDARLLRLVQPRRSTRARAATTRGVARRCAAARRMLVIYARDRGRGAAVLRLPTGVPARRGPGQSSTCSADCRRARRRSAPRGRSTQVAGLSPEQREATSSTSRVRRSAASASRGTRPERGPRVREAQGLGRAQDGAQLGAGGRRRARRGTSRPMRDAIDLRVRAAGRPRARQRRGLRLRAPGPRRPRPRRADRRRATSCSAMPAKNPALARCGRTALEDAPQFKLDIDREKASALGLSLADINQTLSTAWGARVRQRLHRPAAASSASIVQGDAPFAHAARRPRTAGTCATRTGEMVPFSAFATAAMDVRPAEARALQRRAGVRDPGRSRRRARARARRWTTMESLVAQAAAGRRPRVDRPVVPGAAVGLAGAAALRALAARRVPVPRGALRELVDPGRRCCWSCRSACSARVLPRRCAAWRTTSTSRSACSTTIGLSAKNAILIVEFAKELSTAGQDADRGGARGRAAAPAADPDDVARLHPRRAAAGDRDRRRLGRAERDRHRRDRRHARRRRCSASSSSRCSSSCRAPAAGAARAGRSGARRRRRARSSLSRCSACTLAPNYERPAAAGRRIVPGAVRTRRAADQGWRATSPMPRLQALIGSRCRTTATCGSPRSTSSGARAIPHPARRAAPAVDARRARRCGALARRDTDAEVSIASAPSASSELDLFGRVRSLRARRSSSTSRPRRPSAPRLSLVGEVVIAVPARARLRRAERLSPSRRWSNNRADYPLTRACSRRARVRARRPQARRRSSRAPRSLAVNGSGRRPSTARAARRSSRCPRPAAAQRSTAELIADLPAGSHRRSCCAGPTCSRPSTARARECQHRRSAGGLLSPRSPSPACGPCECALTSLFTGGFAWTFAPPPTPIFTGGAGPRLTSRTQRKRRGRALREARSRPRSARSPTPCRARVLRRTSRGDQARVDADLKRYELSKQRYEPASRTT